MRQTFRQAVSKPKPLGPEHNPWFWNPARFGVKFGPADFRSKLKSLGEELEVTWNPVKERWQIWMRSNQINHKICQGWKLLFVVELNGEFVPLDERTLARLYEASVLSSGSAKHYFARVQAEIERETAYREERDRQEAIDIAMPSWYHSQIQVSGYGKSNGSKFSKYHS